MKKIYYRVSKNDKEIIGVIEASSKQEALLKIKEYGYDYIEIIKEESFPKNKLIEQNSIVNKVLNFFNLKASI